MTPEELFNKHYKLAYHVVNKVKGNFPLDKLSMDAADLEQMAFIGLWKASQSFDESKGFKFATYAVPAMRGEISNSMRDGHYSFKVPRMSRKIYNKLKKRIEDGETKPTIEAVMKEFDCRKMEAEVALDLFNLSFIGIDAPVSTGDGKVNVSDVLQDYNADFVDKIILNDELKTRLSILNNKERLILYYTMKEKTQSEISKELGLSQAHVSRLYKGALKKIKEQFEVNEHENQPQFA
jgi:RNA polymerase sigma factor (sigma-70 family)